MDNNIPIYYKWLTPTAHGPFSHFDYSPYLPSRPGLIAFPGDPLPPIMNLVNCRSGYHSSTFNSLFEWHQMNTQILALCIIPTGSLTRTTNSHDKILSSQIQLVRYFSFTVIEHLYLLRLFRNTIARTFPDSWKYHHTIYPPRSHKGHEHAISYYLNRFADFCLFEIPKRHHSTMACKTFNRKFAYTFFRYLNLPRKTNLTMADLK